MKKKVFYGWYIVVACIIIAAAGIGFHNTASIFIIPVTEDLGLSRGEFTFFRTIVTILGAALLPLYGKLAKRYSLKNIMLCGTILSSISLIGYSFASDLWHFYLMAVFNGLFVNASHFMIIGILINRWFEYKRGFALGLAFAGSGLGAAIMNPMASVVIENFDWRWGFRFTGIVALIVLIPTILFLIKEYPEKVGLSPYRKDGSESAKASSTHIPTGLTLAEARKTPAFWFLAIALFSIAIGAAGPHAHIAPFLVDLGYYPTLVATIVSFSMVILTVGKIFMGNVFDRFGTYVGGIILGSLFILSPISALFAATPAAAWFHAFLLGMAATGFSIAANIFVMKFFGEKDFPVILSIFSSIMAFGGAFAPPAMGFVYDIFGTYTNAWYFLIASGFAVFICFIGVNVTGKKIK